MNTYFEKFQEFSSLSGYDLDELVDRKGILEIRLIDEGRRRLSITFDCYLAYRKLDEGDALVTLEEVTQRCELGKSFYLVEESSFLDWFVSQTCGSRSRDHLQHYAVHTINDVIDVISPTPPSLAFL
jgi:hypothetical protein